MARPVIEIKKEQFESLCNLQCTLDEIAGFFKCSSDTEKIYKVYKHTTPNNKVYIGITKERNINNRWQKGKGYWSNKYFTNAINKYGWENITHEIMFENLLKTEAEEKERELIKKYRSSERKFGYNIEKGGSLNKEVSISTREKLRQNALGKKASDNTREKMSKSHKGENCYWYGKHLSNETKRKLSELKKKKIRQYTINGEFVCTYNSMSEIAQQFNVTRQNIYACCSGRRKTACGFIWRYVNG